MINRVMRVALPGLLLALLVAGRLSARSVAIDVNASPGPIVSLAVDAADGSLVTASGGLFRSSDHGRSWIKLALPDALHPGKLRQVASTAAAASSVYAAGPGAGIIRSDDRGKSWRTISDGLPSQEVGAFAVHSFRLDTLYAWIDGKGVFRTEDGGSGWELMDEGPPGDGPPVPVVALAHSTLEGSMNTGWLYAATPDGPYLSMDCF